MVRERTELGHHAAGQVFGVAAQERALVEDLASDDLARELKGGLLVSGDGELADPEVGGLCGETLVRAVEVAAVREEGDGDAAGGAVLKDRGGDLYGREDRELGHVDELGVGEPFSILADEQAFSGLADPCPLFGDVERQGVRPGGVEEPQIAVRDARDRGCVCEEGHSGRQIPTSEQRAHFGLSTRGGGVVGWAAASRA